ncbi:hypothetical protein OAF54_00645 [bacterium]|nr:hypothetical protein [bacterium]
MNKERRKTIDNLIERVGDMQQQIEEDLRNAVEEQDYYDNMPEGIQAGEKGNRAMESADALQGAVGAFYAIDSAFDEVVQHLETGRDV